MDSFTNHERLKINKNYGYLQHVFIIDNDYNHKLNQYHNKNSIKTALDSHKKQNKKNDKKFRNISW